MYGYKPFKIDEKVRKNLIDRFIRIHPGKKDVIERFSNSFNTAI